MLWLVALEPGWRPRLCAVSLVLLGKVRVACADAAFQLPWRVIQLNQALEHCGPVLVDVDNAVRDGVGDILCPAPEAAEEHDTAGVLELSLGSSSSRCSASSPSTGEVSESNHGRMRTSDFLLKKALLQLRRKASSRMDCSRCWSRSFWSRACWTRLLSSMPSRLINRGRCSGPPCCNRAQRPTTMWCCSPRFLHHRALGVKVAILRILGESILESPFAGAGRVRFLLRVLAETIC